MIAPKIAANLYSLKESLRVICFVVFGLCCKGTAKKVKKKLICYCFCSFFLYARALGACGGRSGAAACGGRCVPVFAGGRSGRLCSVRLWCILFYFANLGKIGSARTYTHTHIHAYTRNNF